MPGAARPARPELLVRAIMGPLHRHTSAEGHTKDETSPLSLAAHPGDSLSTAPDSSQRRSPARDAARDAASTAGSRRTGESGEASGGAGEPGGSTDSGTED